MEEKKRVRPTVAQVRELEERISALEGEKALLEKSNMFMEEELKRVRELNLSLIRKNGEIRNELEVLKSRGFWDRVFNSE